MRTRFIKIMCLFSILTLLFSNIYTPKAVSYNDGRFNTYINMGENAVNNNYQIPHMFRQDAPYTYITKYPLVVSGGVEYVPMSMFILYSYIEVNYSGLNEDFYLVNTRNGNYISFNIEENIAYTHNGELMKMETRLFYQTRYIPARKVADALGMMCETYDDPLSGIYAFRISNGKSSKTLPDLLNPFLPEKEPTQEPGNIPEDNPTVPEDKPTIPEVKPDIPEDKPDIPEVKVEPQVPQDPLEKLEKRTLSLCFTGMSYEKINTITTTLKNLNASASFSFTQDEILSNPSLVRKLWIEGNTIMVTAQPDFEKVASQNPDITGKQLDLLYANAYISELESANNALKLVLKTKTRMCTLPYNMPCDKGDGSVFESTLLQAGYLVFKPDVDSGDTPSGTSNAYTISARIKNKVTGGNPKDSFSVNALLNCSEKSYYYILDIASLINQYEKLSFSKSTEYALFSR